MRKKSILLFTIVFVILVQAKAQTITVPDGGFEAWTSFTTFELPDSWVSSDLVWHFPPNNLKTQTVKHDNNSHSGKYAARIQPDTAAGKIWYGFLANNFACSQRASKLAFYYVDSLTNISIGNVSVGFFKYNNTTKKSDSLGGAVWNFPKNISSKYVYVEIPITYVGSDTTKKPDTANIKITIATGATATRPGHVLIDDMSMIPSKGGIAEDLNPVYVNIYPNPANTVLNLNLSQLNTPITSFEIIDNEGRVISRLDHPLDNTSSFNTENLPNGLYYIRVNTQDSHAFGKFMVLHAN